MKLNTATKESPFWLMVVALIAMGTTTTALAASPALQGQITLRPLTPAEIRDYSLTGLQGASGLSAVGVGQPAYLEALVNAAIAPSNIVSVTWTLTSKPIGSAAALAPSPLGTNIPTYKVADRISNSGAPVFQVAGRTFLRPDITGQYAVGVTIVTAGGSGTTNLTQNITAGTYLGANTCALCHSGGVIAEDKYHPWSQTAHATKFTEGINGNDETNYSANSLPFNTVGYDTDTNAVNGGFDDVARQLGWTFPATLNTNNWNAVPAALKNLANIQCENCHGPGSEHAFALGNTNVSNWPRIGKTFAAGDCAQCHDTKDLNSVTIKSAEWNNSLHARTTRSPSGPGREACARCHTAGGFAGYARALSNPGSYTTNNADTAYTAITCATCHEPHDATNSFQLRAGPTITLGGGTTVTNAGLGGFCMNCHQSRNGSVSNSIVNYPLGQQTWAGGSAFGPHDNPAADMIEGVNGWTYGQVIPSSAHRYAVTNTCVGCHMQPVASTDPAFLLAGGHTFKVRDDAGISLVGVCQKCHGPSLTSLDYPVQDYNGDGVIEGVQTEVQSLLNKLSTLLPSSTYVASGNYVADGLVKTISFSSTRTNWPSKFLKAAYNWQFVNNDLSKGVHNAPYAVGLLKASIGDLTGDVNNDGLSDAWQIQYFGSTTNASAAPNAAPAGDGIPNWLKWSLGLDPRIAGISVPGGVVWASGSTLYNPAGTNAVQIFTAAEVAFDTELGKTYQIQGISALGSAWQNVGGPIAGTGATISYVTPTRQNVQQFFRVVHTP